MHVKGIIALQAGIADAAEPRAARYFISRISHARQLFLSHTALGLICLPTSFQNLAFFR